MTEASTPLELRDITLCAIDCVNPVHALRALDISSSACQFGDVVFLSDTAARHRLAGCRMEVIPRIDSQAAYSRFVLKDLGGYLRTSHLLLVQWDGYVIHPEAWRPEFMAYDYIGAPWGFRHDNHRIGNGGFSLRSRRLFDALQDAQITDLVPEDEAIGRTYRNLLEQKYGIHFPPEDLAGAFSFETTYPTDRTFGFHGLFNMWMVLHPDELRGFVAELSDHSVRGPQFLRLARNYFDTGSREAARLLVERRLEVLPDDADAQRLLAQLAASRAIAATRSVGRNDPCPCNSGKRHKHCCGSLAQSDASARPATVTADMLLRAAVASQQAGHLDDSQALFGRVLDIDPKNAIARHFLGVLKMLRGDPVDGERLIREALASRGDIPDFHNNLGLCLRMQGRLGEAIDAYGRALAISPTYVEARNNLGLDLRSTGRCTEAIAHFEEAVRQQPLFAEAHWNLGLSCLSLGDMARGWTEYEWRLRCRTFAGDGLTLDDVESWHGQPLDGKSLLVRREQGAGDTLQFLRFVPELARRGARVLLDVTADLAELAGSIAPGIEIVDRTAGLPRADYYINLMSLPHRLGITLDTLPAQVPYLQPDSKRIAAWHERLSTFPGRRIGVVWAGNPNHQADRNRSCPLKALQPLFGIPGVSWFSLQKGDAAGQLAELPPAALTDLGAQLDSYADTAAALLGLDLLITVDTSVAHLAGAINRPAWVMLPHAPDWRWFIDRDDSPWYPGMQLFRQSTSGDWDGLCARLAQALAKGLR